MEWNKIQVLVGTVDYTGYLADKEQTASLPDGPEIGRASFVLLDDGTMPAINDWSAITLKGGGTAATVNLWAGYVTRQQSEPFSETAGAKRLLTLDCQSAAVKLLTSAPVTEVYGGGDNETITYDRDIVADLVSTYAPALYNVAKIGTADQVEIDYIGFAHESLRSALNKMAKRTGRTFGVDAVPEFWYRDFGSESVVYEYKLHDDESLWDAFPEILPMAVKPVYDRDATELRNSVRVIGGATLSTVQVETFPGNDVTTVFQVDYRPDVVISVEVGGIAQTVGIMYVDDPADFDCLVEYDRRQFHFDTAPASGKDLVIQYRYSTRVDVTMTDATSIASVGTIWAPVLEDTSISSAAQGSALGSAYLASTQAMTRATLSTRHGGTAGDVLPWQPSRSVYASAEALGWDEEELLIRGVTLRAQPRPGGDGSCVIIWDLDVGSGPASAGRTFGAQWNNTEVLPQNVAPDGIERLGVEASAGETDHGALTGLADDDHTGYLLATGARTGASSQAQTFTNGIIGPTWKPASNSTTALQMQNAAGTTAILTVDTTNATVGIGTGALATTKLAVLFNQTGASSIYGASYTTRKIDASGTVFIVGQVAGAINVASGANSTAAVAIGFQGGVESQAGSGRTASITSGYAISAAAPTLTGAGTKSITSTYGLYVYNQGATGVTNAHGVYVAAISGAATNNKALVTEGGSVIFNENGTDSDFRIEGDTATHLLFVDASADAVGIGTSAPGARFHVLQTSSDAGIRDIVRITHNSSGTPGTGFGAAIALALQTTTTENVQAGRLAAAWYTATHASRAGDLIGYASDASGEREGWRVRATGSAAALGVLGAEPIARKAHVADPAGGATVDAEARAAINAILVSLEGFGFHATS